MFFLNKVNIGKFMEQCLGSYQEKCYFCNVFFMVLDLRFRKIGSRETSFFFFK